MSIRAMAATQWPSLNTSPCPARSVGVFGVIKRELRRRSAIEPVIGHMKSEGHLGRCHLKGRDGNAANIALSAVGHNLHRVLAWLRILLRPILIALWRRLTAQTAIKSAS